MKKISRLKRTRNVLAHRFGPILSLVGLMSVSIFVLEPVALAGVDPSWIPTGNLNSPRPGHTATLLPNGKVLVVGGRDGNSPPNFLNSSELYDPATRTWSVTGSLNTPRYSHTATLLPNGKVLVAGGVTNTTPPDFGITTSAELYDPATNTWSLTGDLSTPRAGHTATLLTDGRVLVAGGSTAELYDPVTGAWSVTGDLITSRYGHTATLLQTGKVLVVGGLADDDFNTILPTAELYDPATGTWSITGSLNVSRYSFTATLLPNGKVLAAGGYLVNWVPAGGGLASSPTSLNSAELYDPANGTWSISASLNNIRNSHTATLLQNGKVLVAGGSYWTTDGNTPNDGTYPCGQTLTCSPKELNAAGLYDPTTGGWSITASLNTPRVGATATRLQNGQVLVAGGDNLGSAELYNSHRTSSLDFDGDGKSDIGIYRNGAWYVIRSSDNGQTAVSLGGSSNDIPVPADYDGDGMTDEAVYSNGVWTIHRSSDGGTTVVDWGGPDFIPVPADYDGDGKADIAVYHPSGVWLIVRSSDGGTTVVGWGGPDFIPVPADYDGDGKTDIAVYHPSGIWSIVRSSDGGNTLVGWGGPSFIPVPADYDGDGKADIAVYHPSGIWSIIRSSNGGNTLVGWGGPSFMPVPADYDGDGKADIAVYNPNGVWSIVRSSDGGKTLVGFGGTPQDIPLK